MEYKFIPFSGVEGIDELAVFTTRVVNEHAKQGWRHDGVIPLNTVRLSYVNIFEGMIALRRQ